MQNTGTLSAHHKNVTRSCKNYAKNLLTNNNLKDIQYRKSLLADKSDASTNKHKQPQLQLSLLSHSKFIKYRRKKCVKSWFLLVLICVIIKFEFVIGAVNSNSVLNSTPNVNNNNINNKYDKYHNHDKPSNYTRTLLDEIDDDIALSLERVIEDFTNFTTSSPRPRVIYQNEFAVHILGGIEVANEIARKYGFTNLGQIGSLKNYYLFHHQHVKKRSLETGSEHHENLNKEPEVRWVQQQHEKIRKKRDFQRIKFPEPSSSLRSDPLALLRSIATGSQIKYRSTDSHLTFPDPLFKEQWYMNGGAKDGLDMNVGPAWQKGYTGKGVVVSILDDGIQRNHPDLDKNYDPEASYDINDNDSDPMPRDNGDNKHGTRCAGEVAGIAFNDICGVGVAYKSKIGGVRMLDGTVNDAVEAKALGLNPNHIDVYSASWGPEDDGSTVDGPGPLARRAFIYGVTSGRLGKGSIFVWASGNGGRYTDSCNCDGYTNSIFTLSISSATQGGYKPWYLEECSSTLATTYSSGTPGHDKSVATVDMDGALRPDRICTVEHTGTSASAPLAAGIVALALEANPSLTWRDMQYLVVLTSRPEPLEKENGWVLNGSKRKVSHKFGYGLMDAGGMVNLAEKWIAVPAQHICKSREINEDRQIQGSVGYTLQTHMDVNGCAGTVNEVRYLEHVQCKITLRFFPRGNLRILLTSPSGTTSTLLFERPRDVAKSNFDDWPFMSVHFWGERAEGRWTLQIINGGRRRVSQAGVLSKWQLIFYGTQTNPIRLKTDGQSTSARAVASPLGTDWEWTTGENLNSFSNNFNGFVNYQNSFASAGSNVNKKYATLDGRTIPTSQRENVMADSNNKLVILHDCDPECDQQGCYGRGATNCVACKHYRLDNTCVSRCPPRSFPNQGGVCWPCHESCETCAGAGQDSCLNCSPSYNYVTDLAVCLQTCPDGYFENYENKTCVPCEENCASCQDRPDYCTSCEHHLVMHEHKCYAACPKNTYETEDFNCADCHPSCASCNGSSETQCIQCKPNRFSLEGKCLTSCPDGFYGEKKRKECLPCPFGCATCSNDKCLSCKTDWVKNKKDKCVTKGSNNCDESEYYDNGHCRSCHSTCETCMGPTENDCLTCSNNLLLQNNKCVSTCDKGYFMEAGVCTMCLHTCTQCVSRMNCTECVKGLQLQSGECRATCADGYYSDRGTCVKCYLSCDTCSGPRRDQCVRCPENWKLAAGECHPECPEGFFKTEFGCEKCHHYCKTCNGAGPLSCTSCPIHFMLEGGLCTECLSMQYYDSLTQTCKTCHESCRSCSGPGQYSCVTCAFPLHLDRLNNQCVPCCATDATPEDQSCCHCDKDTGDCINSSPAGKRRIAAEKQLSQLTDEGNLFNSNGNDAALIDGGGGGLMTAADSASTMDQIKSPVTFVGVVAVAICSVIVIMFVTIFTVLQKRNHKNSFTGIRYDKLNDQEHMKPLKLESRNTKLSIPSEHVDQELSHYDDMLDDVNRIRRDEDDEDYMEDEETKFIRSEKNKSNKHYSYYTSSERT